MEKIVLFLLISLGAMGAHGGSIHQMNDDQLLNESAGLASGDFESRLADALKGPDAESLVGRAIANPALRELLPVFTAYLPSGDLRDKVIMFCLRDEDIWVKDISSPKFGWAARRLAEPALSSEFFYLQNSDEEGDLGLSLMTRRGRLAMAELYEKVASLPRSERVRGNWQMESVTAKVQSIVSIYGNDDFVAAHFNDSLSEMSKEPKREASEGKTESPSNGVGKLEDPSALSEDSWGKWLWGALAVAVSIFAFLGVRKVIR